MTKKKRCPFCDFDLTDGYKLIERSDASGIRVSLCIDCGEPIIFTEKGFRRPTEDEHLDLYECTTIRDAREAFTRIKEGNVEDQVLQMWVKYYTQRLRPSLTDDSMNSGQKVYNAFQDVFFSGAAMMLACLKHEVHEAESRGAFVGKMALLEMEIEAFCKYVREEEPLS